ncbi:MAG: flagellar biosynthesis protein FlhB [Armatimonadota bacterium]|nr:flagellar biosynthesis protein FlhB [Armatimonadota bacterium]MDR5703369.1 flagellar biosynthesis protein FlhB [Armatimonadota bacterium]
MADQNRTEQATPKRRQEARKRGYIPRSPELTASLSLLGGLLALAVFGPAAMRNLLAYLQGFLLNLRVESLSEQDIAIQAIMVGVQVTAPLVAGSMVAGVVASLGQAGFILTSRPIEPRLERINPIAGFGRLFSFRSVMELGKAFLKIFGIGWVALSNLRAGLPLLPGMLVLPPGTLVSVAGGEILRLAIRLGVALVVVGVLDFLYQRYDWERNLRMTKQELREEIRETEGDPLVRAQLKARQRALARQRMLRAVPKATVVVTNPVHIAVALRYDPPEMAAPVVVAKGARLMAERIKEIARRHGVPVVENPPLAQALYRAVPVGHPIPASLYRAVAEILAMLYRLSRTGHLVKR